MEHILQFAVSIDEDTLVKKVEESASRQIVKLIQDEINGYTRGYNNTKLNQIFRNEVSKLVNENKDQIIEETIKNLTKSLTRTKAVKEAVGDALCKLEAEKISE